MRLLKFYIAFALVLAFSSAESQKQSEVVKREVTNRQQDKAVGPEGPKLSPELIKNLTEPAIPTFKQKSPNAQRVVPLPAKNQGFSSRILKTQPPRNWMRVYGPRPRRMLKSRGIKPPGVSRWFFGDDSEEVPVLRTRKVYSRFSRHPPVYENYPPYWPSGGGRPKLQKPKALLHGFGNGGGGGHEGGGGFGGGVTGSGGHGGGGFGGHHGGGGFGGGVTGSGGHGGGGFGGHHGGGGFGGGVTGSGGHGGGGFGGGVTGSGGHGGGGFGGDHGSGGFGSGLDGHFKGGVGHGSSGFGISGSGSGHSFGGGGGDYGFGNNGGHAGGFVKHDCNSCNSVPWTPILKPSTPHNTFNGALSYGVPTIDVHHEDAAYASDQQQTFAVPPPSDSTVLTPVHGSTVSDSYGLPIGNIPIGHGLLPPLKPSPPGLVPPPQTLSNNFIQPIPFPELSPVPVLPIHNPNPFLLVNTDTQDLVPPVPPQKSNVIFTISEPEANPTPVLNNHLNNPNLHGDQHTSSSSLIDTRLIPQVHGFNHFNTAQSVRTNLDIVKSVPLAEYTSSIEYPLQIIQSPPYVDITTAPLSNNSGPVTYEKKSSTGSQKISDILLGLVDDSDSKKSNVHGKEPKIADNGSEQKIYVPTALPPEEDAPKNIYTNGQVYSDGQRSGPEFSDASPPWSNLQFTSNQPVEYIEDPSHEPKLETEVYPGDTPPPWLVPAQSNLAPQWILPVENSPSVPYPILSHEDGIATAVNGELSPTPPPQPMNDPQSKKIQIIIPYTTKESQDNAPDLETLHSEIRKTSVPLTATVKPPKQAQVKQPILPNSNAVEFTLSGNHTQNNKYLSDVQHILALNIKQLLNDEVEKPKQDQNIRLQKNIDNWTALEYSNHKTVAKKEPQEVISFANAVTSIPGTSISHLLLTSKKIPDQYLTTTPLPSFDDPETTQYTAAGVSVESRPFTTKSYDTSDVYSTVTRHTPFGTTQRTNKNHRNGYTEVVKTKANQWGKLTENLILPENVANRSATVWSDKKVTVSNDDRIYVVTPAPVWGDSSKRTTRHVTMTEKPELFNQTSKVQKSEKTKISKFNKPKPIQKFYPTTKAPKQRKITKIEIKNTGNPKRNGSEERYDSEESEEIASINDVFPFRNGGALPVELAQANSTTDKERSEFGKRKERKGTVEVTTATSIESEGLEVTTTTSLSSSTSIEIQFSRKESNTPKPLIWAENEFGLKLRKESNPNEAGRNSSDFVTEHPVGKSSPKEVVATSKMPAGVFGTTRKAEFAPRDEELITSDLASLNETIRLLREYLREDVSEEKTDSPVSLKEDRF